MALSTVRLRLTLAVMLALSLTLALSAAVFIPTGAHAQAATQEKLTAFFTNGPNGATTVNSYTGNVTINVSGTGQAAGPRYSDAFYIFTDDAGKPITPEHLWDFSLCIDYQPVGNFVAIPLYRSDHTYQFAISIGSNPQQITFGVCDQYTADNSGSFAITVKTQTTWTIPTVSTKWSGYANHGILNPVAYTRVDGSWTMPSEPCLSSTPSNNLDIWDGLGGIGNNPLEQAGVRLHCDHGTFQVFVFYELLIDTTHAPPVLITPNTSILAGDVITATTQYLGTKSATNTCSSDPNLGSPGGNGVYKFSISDERTGWEYVTTTPLCASDDPAARNSADWIVEGHGTLLNFNNVDFSACRSSNGSISVGPLINPYTMVGFQSTPPFVFVKTSPSSLTSDGAGFTLFWKHA